MSISATQDGGRRVRGDTNLGRFDFHINPSASGKRLRLVDEHGIEHGAGEIDIRDVPPQQAEAIARAAGRRGCRGCGG